jgi:OmpA-OmpF porin, OOP family
MKNFYALLLFFLPFLASAQQVMEYSGGVGLSYYFGEMDNFPEKFGVARPVAQIGIRRHVANPISFRANLIVGAIAGKDSRGAFPDRGFSFKSPLFEISLLAEIYPFGKFKKDAEGMLTAQPKKFSPYLFGGVGGAFLNPKVSWKTSESPQVIAGTQIDQAANTSGGRLALPFGGGFRIALSNTTFLGGELAWRFTQNDYIDGVSAAGDPDNNDWYMAGAITFSKAFGNTKKQSRTSRNSDGDGAPITKTANDSDGDGVPDAEDGCPSLAGDAKYRGCPPVDRDKDGVADAEDLCPDMPGSLMYKGCADSDGDGLGDNTDDCPGIIGTAALNGCPDSDGDGVSDAKDKCPTISGLKNNDGCPENVSSRPANVPYKAVYFDSQKQDWFSTSYTTLDEVVQILKADPAIKIRVEGHTDNTGDIPANNLLSERRARLCFDYLVEKGIDAGRITYMGFGARKPAASNDTQDGRKLNRRVEIHFYK